jgi:hypothetical protein
MKDETGHLPIGLGLRLRLGLGLGLDQKIEQKEIEE